MYTKFYVLHMTKFPEDPWLRTTTCIGVMLRQRSFLCDVFAASDAAAVTQLLPLSRLLCRDAAVGASCLDECTNGGCTFVGGCNRPWCDPDGAIHMLVHGFCDREI